MTEKSKSSSSSRSSSGKSSKRSGSSSGLGKADHVIIRNLFALNILRRQFLVVIISFLAATISLFSAYQVIKVKTPPQYIQLTEDGRIFPVAPLNVESASDSEIIAFSADSVKWLNTYDFINWRDQLHAQSPRFVPIAWEEFVTTLTESSNLNTVREKSLVVSAVPRGQPYIQKRGVAQDAFVWYVRVPVEVRYSSMSAGTKTSEIPSQDGVVSLYIQRVPLEVNLRGYAIRVYQFEIGPDQVRKGQ